jgi:NADPH:quinone reductase-like Zn-dependent oxidoreductase
MKAIVNEEYGPLDVLKLKEVPKPTPKENEVLVKIYAASVNFGDAILVKGKPFMVRLMGMGLLKPKNTIIGTDIAGQVEAVGENVTRFKPGDEVFADLGACGFGAYAEFVSVPEDELALKPLNISHEEAAALPQAASVALQGLKKGHVKPGQKVLINGASGGIGTFAVQIAKSFGAEVTGVCSLKNLELVRSLGADHVIDYKQEDFTQKEQRYDLILDLVANRSVPDYMRTLSPNGVYVAIAFNPVAIILGAMISMIGSKKVTSITQKHNVKDLVYLKELVEASKLVPVIDRSYPLSEVSEAMRYLEEELHHGKVVITVENNTTSGDV